MAPPNAPQAGDSQGAVAQGAQDVSQGAVQQGVSKEAVPQDECEFDSDCGFGKRCDYPLCKPCAEGQQCHCPKICMVVTAQGELREAKR